MVGGPLGFFPEFPFEIYKGRAGMEYYEKQIAIPSFGLECQNVLLSKTIVIVGCGGLCAGVLPSVGGMGCAKLVLIDGDRVEKSNLHRQSIHGGKIGMLKTESAKLFAQAQNPSLKIDSINEPLTMENAKKLLSGASLVFDCTDNLPTRRLISDAVCSKDLAQEAIPVVSGSALKLSGQILIYNLKERDSYRTLLGSQGASCSANDAQQDCSSAGVFGPVPQLIGHLMAVEGAKILLGWNKDDTTAKYNFMIYDFRTGVKYFTLKERVNEPKAIWDSQSYARGVGSVEDEESKSWREMVEDRSRKILIDVRPEFVVKDWPSKQSEALNIPLEKLNELLEDDSKVLSLIDDQSGEHLSIYIFCQRGISCVRAAQGLRQKIKELSSNHSAACSTSRLSVYSVREGVMNLQE